MLNCAPFNLSIYLCGGRYRKPCKVYLLSQRSPCVSQFSLVCGFRGSNSVHQSWPKRYLPAGKCKIVVSLFPHVSFLFKYQSYRKIAQLANTKSTHVPLTQIQFSAFVFFFLSPLEISMGTHPDSIDTYSGVDFQPCESKL